jgi:voltage-gated potassium channel
MTRERRLLASLTILVLITFGGALGFVIIEGANLGDALYMTVLTISTVGFEEVFPLSTTGRLLATGIIVVGVGTALYTAGTALEIGLERFLGGEIRRRRMTRDIDSLTDHVIVAGFGRVGSHTWESLNNENIPSVVIESEPTAVDDAIGAGALVVEGDATRNEVLEAAGIERARALIACVREDSDNLVIVLSAKNRRRDLPVISRANEPQSRDKLRLAGADRVVSPPLVGAHRLAALAAEPRLDEFVDVILHGKLMELRIEGFEIGERSVLSGQLLSEADIRSMSGAQVLALEAPGGDIVLNPEPSTMIRPGHNLIAIGTSEQVERLRLIAQG